MPGAAERTTPSLGAMGNVLTVYIGDGMRQNFSIAVDAGVWGCPASQESPLAAGDKVLFVGSVPGGPRQTGERPLDYRGEPVDHERSWLSRTAAFCWLADATTGWFEDESEIWETEPDTYKYRFRFENAEDLGSLSLAPGIDLSREASLAIKMSGLQVRNGGLQTQLVPGAGLLVDGGSATALLDESNQLDPAEFQGDLSVPREAAARAEQAQLRRLLLGASTSCALCGESLPAELLVAAHIKRRSLCTDEEKRDLGNVAMLACLLGCDALFELGLVTVDLNGTIEVNRNHYLADSCSEIADRLAGGRCAAHNAKTRKYFEWHRNHHQAA